MFNFVHHVRILVHNADDMVEYMEKNFGMKPVKVQVYESRGMKNAIYKVGETNLEFTEPLDMNSRMGQFLTQEGPGFTILPWCGQRPSGCRRAVGQRQ
jgi:catechol 2,3-dioxygenase-like lactoylglutathione lyase family enzyme